MSIVRTFAMIVFLITASMAATALADGMMIAPWQYEIYETDQIAYLEYSADTGVEELHILPSLHSDTQDFAWVIPVPSLPELDVSDVDIFLELANLTAPEHRYRDEGWGCSRFEKVMSLPQDNGGVDILEEELVGIYRTMIVGADDAGALTDSLTAWGFLHEDNADEVSAMLGTYIDEEWYFVTLKVDSAAFENDPHNWDWDWYGAMYPIALTFAADAPVYPMRISALSAGDDTSVTLYMKADRRMDFDGAETRYANRLTGAELRALGSRYPRLAQMFEEGDFLTKLVRNYTPAQMDADVYPEPADTNAEYRRIYYSGIPLTSALLLVMFGALMLRARRRGRQ